MFIFRLFHIFLIFLRYRCFFLLGIVIIQLRFLYNPQSKKQAQRFKRFLIKAGPTFIKLAQVLSTRVDIFSEIYLKELNTLRDRVKPTKNKDIIRLIEQDLGMNISAVFKDFSETPIASASVAQVHKATLLTGEKVAVKIIKPNTEIIFKKDIAVLKFILGLFQIFSARGRISKPLRIINHLEGIMKSEIDLRFEAAAADEFRERFLRDESLYVPKIYWKFVTKNMLIEEWIEAISLNNLEKLKEEKVDFQVLTRSITRIFFLQILDKGYFHGDMHPGNIFIKPSGVICFVDFGIMGRVDLKLRQYLLELFLAFVNKDYKKAAEIHFKAGWITNKYNVDDFALACRCIMEKVLYLPQKDIKLGGLLAQLFVISTKFEMEIQEDLLLLQKNLVYLENLGRSLSPDANMWVLAKEVISENVNKKNLFQQYKSEFCDETLKNVINIKNNFLEYNSIVKQQNEIMYKNGRMIQYLIMILCILLFAFFFK